MPRLTPVSLQARALPNLNSAVYTGSQENCLTVNGALMISRVRLLVFSVLALVLFGAACSKTPAPNDSVSTSFSPAGARVFEQEIGRAHV